MAWPWRLHVAFPRSWFSPSYRDVVVASTCLRESKPRSGRRADPYEELL